MQSIDGHSEACCNIPPVVGSGYSQKGTYETIGGLKTYVTGSASAKKAIFMIYDIFGFFEQTIQGADILAQGAKGEGYQVFMPDFFDGNPADIAWYPPVKPEQQEALAKWFPTRTPAIGVEKLPKLMKAIEEKYGEKTWGAVGYCWGGKVVSATSGENTPFKAAVQLHPGLITPEDAAKVTIPTCILASGEEKKGEVDAYEKELKVEKHVETFADQVHGWMSARGDLKDEKVKKEYERGYGIVVGWLEKYL